MRIVAALILAVFLPAFLGCKRDSIQSVNVLYGTWVKGVNGGDTLQFLKKDGKNILRYNISSNAMIPAFTEMEYTYLDGKFSVNRFPAGAQNFYRIESFNWKQAGVEFEIQGIELFLFLLSTQVYFTYKKL